MAIVALLTRRRMLTSSLRSLGGPANWMQLGNPPAKGRTVAGAAITRLQLHLQNFRLSNDQNQDNGLLAISTSWTCHLERRHYSHKAAQPAEATADVDDEDPKPRNTSAAASTSASDLFGDAANMGLFAKFKHMYKQYWYVLIPVHVITSVGWFGGFYYLSKSGVDVPSLLQYVHLSETIIEKVQGSDMGHYAIAYLCYKVTTPLRYALTLGCTTVSIKYLVQHGYIKPMPSKSELIKMYEDKKATRASAKADKAEKAEKGERK
ncbi:hypothetical protein KR018_002452 [Drosophila ironensis]|nr:hypothetical protein KR018_002452 [Drosophila ironensis]